MYGTAQQSDNAEWGVPQYAGAEPDYATADSTYATPQQECLDVAAEAAERFDEFGDYANATASEHTYDAAAAENQYLAPSTASNLYAMPAVGDDPHYYEHSYAAAQTALYSEASPSQGTARVARTSLFPSPYDEVSDSDLGASRLPAKKDDAPHSNMGTPTAEGLAF